MMINLALLAISGVATIPYSPRTDDFISTILLLCFFLTAFALSHNKKYMLLQLKNFFSHRDRASSFTTSSSIDLRMLMLLSLQTCVMGGICMFNYFNDTASQSAPSYPSWAPILSYVGAFFGYFLIKNILYIILGWTFSSRGEVSRWLEAYMTLVYHFGFLMFPFVLLLVYFDLSITYLVIISLFSVVFVKLLMLFKWWKFFFKNKSGSLLLIVYFCALEVIPCFLLYRGLVDLNELFTIKL